jgi:hypothetical protein
MIPQAILIPGHVLPLCVGCQHRTPDLSHPSPCGVVRWESARHRTLDRAVDVDGQRCGDYKPSEATQ